MKIGTQSQASPLVGLTAEAGHLCRPPDHEPAYFGEGGAGRDLVCSEWTVLYDTSKGSVSSRRCETEGRARAVVCRCNRFGEHQVKRWFPGGCRTEAAPSKRFFMSTSREQ